jgi:zinc protease
MGYDERHGDTSRERRPMLKRVVGVGTLIAAWSLSISVSTAAAQSRPWPSERPPRPLPARDVKFPPYQLQTLPNGLQVVAVLHHEQPAVSMRLLIRAGSASDPKNKLGLVHELASLLDQGTESKSAGELNDAIDSIGGATGAGAATDVTYMNMVVMKDSFETGLRMLSDMARHPAFAPAEIERQRQQTLSGLQVSLDDPDYVADAVFDRLVYGFHPYGLPHTGTPETISGINRDDLIAFHKKYFAPNNAILAVVGDVTAEEAFDTVKKVFGDWERKDIPIEAFIDPPAPARRLIVVNKPDAVQTEVRVGNIGIPRKHPDYMAVNLAIRILGGEGSNRLHNVLRTQRALTYGAQANLDTLKESGDFVAQTNTRSDATAEVLRLTFDEFWRLQRETVSERELADAKAYLTGSFPLTIETPDAIAMQVLNVLFYGLPIDDLQTFRERVNAVTVDDIQRVARAYLKPDRLSVVLVGNAAAFAPTLKGVGFNSYETVEIGRLDLTTADFKRAGAGVPAALPRFRPVSERQPAAYRPGDNDVLSRSWLVERPIAQPLAGIPNQGFVSGRAVVEVPDQRGHATDVDWHGVAPEQSRDAVSITPQEGEKAKALLDLAVMAKGGLEKLKGIKRITARTKTSMTAPDGRAQEAESTTYLEYPDHVRVETTLPQGSIVQIYDGEHAWVRDPAGVHDVPERSIRDLQSSLKRDTISLLLAAEAGTIRARLLPDVKDDAGKMHHALELSSNDLDPLVLYVDPQTGLIAKQTYVVGGAGQPVIEEIFSDYRRVDSIQIAYAAMVRVGGKPTLERHVNEIAINPSFNATLFKRPAS